MELRRQRKDLGWRRATNKPPRRRGAPARARAPRRGLERRAGAGRGSAGRQAEGVPFCTTTITESDDADEEDSFRMPKRADRAASARLRWIAVGEEAAPAPPRRCAQAPRGADKSAAAAEDRKGRQCCLRSRRTQASTLGKRWSELRGASDGSESFRAGGAGGGSGSGGSGSGSGDPARVPRLRARREPALPTAIARSPRSGRWRGRWSGRWRGGRWRDGAPPPPG